MRKKPLGLYVHLPFCAKKCAYCDFPSESGQMGRREEYTEALIQEIRSRGEADGHPFADTVYLGGGTPSLMRPDQITRILAALQESFSLDEEAEISCEINPGAVSLDFLTALKNGGVNRLSIGVQSFDPDELRFLGRQHTEKQAKQAVLLAREVGFININLDLMTGLPGQSADTLAHSLRQALSLKPTHLSCYSLILEEGTPLFDQVNRGEVALLSQEEDRALYHQTVASLQEAGYVHYEISSFAKPGFACRHNLHTWEYQEYLGFGAAAAGFYQGIRQKNPDTIKAYLGGVAPEQERPSPLMQMVEHLLLSLRLVSGLRLPAFKKRHGRDLLDAFPEATQKNLDAGLLESAGDFLRLTPLGLDLMDQVLLDYFPDA